MFSVLLLQYQVDCVATDDNMVGLLLRWRISESDSFSPSGQGEEQGWHRLLHCHEICIAHGIVTVLRMFGIFTHSQMDKRMWELVAANISRRGNEYRQKFVMPQTAQRYPF
jgi:hypothetical protein